ncbi:hypothetical protein M413DRAFT_250897 [Hebeloma cylindrosporum]|uniref:Uncharacterized protein n=1 Tax=Hebeloma cylindrosporum TaxID=76867 RepID=A0A0C3C1M9_HEBCY|nr:hypothetical protein M413DRAFT_250897 [Hebeloma cylindrosporum h7]
MSPFSPKSFTSHAGYRLRRCSDSTYLRPATAMPFKFLFNILRTPKPSTTSIIKRRHQSSVQSNPGHCTKVIHCIIIERLPTYTFVPTYRLPSPRSQ